MACGPHPPLPTRQHRYTHTHTSLADLVSVCLPFARACACAGVLAWVSMSAIVVVVIGWEEGEEGTPHSYAASIASLRTEV